MIVQRDVLTRLTAQEFVLHAVPSVITNAYKKTESNISARKKVMPASWVAQ
ncbi:MAG: hypothetical protein GYA36_21355 [Veillonellaceae bacterium]|nr:hypothetical protein [Veillonellaceae bacterium]